LGELAGRSCSTASETHLTTDFIRSARAVAFYGLRTCRNDPPLTERAGSQGRITRHARPDPGSDARPVASASRRKPGGPLPRTPRFRALTSHETRHRISSGQEENLASGAPPQHVPVLLLACHLPCSWRPRFERVGTRRAAYHWICV